MPLGWQRLNVRQKGPNESIVFIKPLEGPDKAIAQDFLERVAAICVPIMKANNLAVVSLEEHVPNSEFVGRNFNAGEVIQLVLKAPGSGRWLPFSYVQMVMMHELAHCKQMNHSRAFWKVRNQYSDELKGLWSKGYTGEGLWGRGQALYTGQYTEDSMPASDYLYEHPCGGTYRTSRRGKRKRKNANEKPTVSYAERKQRRILKKFGAGGTALGDDDSTRIKLEDGKKPTGKPRVAGSKRGRDLRAAAALARFEQSKEQPIKEESETDSEYESDLDSHESGTEAVDTDGRKLTDSKGNGLVKVCEDEDINNDPEARNELRELSDIRNWAKPLLKPDSSKAARSSTSNELLPLDLNHRSTANKGSGDETGSRIKPIKDERPRLQKPHSRSHSSAASNNHGVIKEEDISTASESEDDEEPFFMKHTIDRRKSEDDFPVAESAAPDLSGPQICEICSLENKTATVTCAACSHVLDVRLDPRSWRCDSLTCQGGKYVNAGDAGVCGLCSARKPNL